MKQWLRQWRNQRRFAPYGNPEFIHPSARISRNSKLQGPVCVGPGCRVKQSSIGGYSYLAYDIRINDATIGRYCSIGPEVIIGGLGKHPTDHFSTSPLTYSPHHPLSQRLGHSKTDLGFEETAPVTIGHDVWIGARAIIVDGVTIGHGAIIGANTVVAKDVPPYAVFYGSPPKAHRFRFPEEAIARLKKSEWWNDSPDQINDDQILALLQNHHPSIPEAPAS